MRPTWNDLQLHNVDLHFHAGTERPEQCSALDFVSYAVATGRRIVGMTDHFGRFLGRSKKTLHHYPGTLEGYRAFANEIRSAAEGFPDSIVLFGPEMGASALGAPQGSLAFDGQDVDFFIAEPSPATHTQTFGEALVESVRETARARRRYSCPGFLGHPLRSVINEYVGKSGPGPKLPNSGPLPPLVSMEDPIEDVEGLLQIDIASLARELVKCDVPIELNQSSWGRMLAMNHESFLDRYLLFYRALIDRGARVILGSDTHNAEHGTPTPFIAARILGISPQEMTFLGHWLGKPP